jgi:hypothetical protein
MSRLRNPRSIALAWGAATLLVVALAGLGPGVSREEAHVLAAAGAAGSTLSDHPLRPPLPALLARASGRAGAAVGLPHLVAYRLSSALAAGLLAALLALLGLELFGPLVAALAPALLLVAPRLLLPLTQAGPAAAAGALALAALLAYRRAIRAERRAARTGWAIGTGLVFGLALAVQLEAVALLAAVAVHAVFLAIRSLLLRPAPPPPPQPSPYAYPPRSEEPAPPPAPVLHARCGLLALAAMGTIGPALALALWPALWADPLGRLRAALAALPGDGTVLYMGRLLASPHPPWGYPLIVTGAALPATVALAMAAGLVLAVARTFRRSSGGAERTDELLLLLAGLAPLVAAQAGLAARAPGPGPWFAAFPVLALLAARAVVEAARAVVPSRARTAAASLAAILLLPGVVAAIHAYPHLGASWGELAGGTPGAASLGLPRHDGEAAAALLPEISARAAPGARIHWTSLPPAALAIYAADGRIRPDLVPAASLEEADLAVVPLAGRPRQDELQVWAALRTTAPVAGVFLDEVPLAWVYARPGAWR